MTKPYYSESPYSAQYKNLNYSKATPERTYIKILKYVYDNPKSKKVDIVSSVFAENPIIKKAWLSDKPATELRGYAITYFGQLVNDGLLIKSGAGHNIVFTISDDGVKLLKKCKAIS